MAEKADLVILGKPDGSGVATASRKADIEEEHRLIHRYVVVPLGTLRALLNTVHVSIDEWHDDMDSLGALTGHAPAPGRPRRYQGGAVVEPTTAWQEYRGTWRMLADIFIVGLEHLPFSPQVVDDEGTVRPWDDEADRARVLQHHRKEGMRVASARDIRGAIEAIEAQQAKNSALAAKLANPREAQAELREARRLLDQARLT